MREYGWRGTARHLPLPPGAIRCTLTAVAADEPAGAAPAASSNAGLTVAAVEASLAAASTGTGGEGVVESAAVTLAAVVAIFEHIFVLSIDEGEQNVVASLSALGDEIST